MNKILLLVVAMLVSGVTIAGDPVAGQQKSAACAACHGPDGNSPIPTNPNLAGQYADYLIQALSEYKSGARPNPIMAGMAAPLTPEDIEDIAAWFSSQKGLNILPKE